MPIRKVWRESRWQFFFILAALLVLTSASVSYNANAERVVIESKDFHEAGMRTIRGALFLFRGFSAVFLGLGGFLRARTVGTVDYTLSLPVSKTRWFLYRSLNGALQSMAAALIPALAIPVMAAMSGGDYPAGDAFLLGLAFRPRRNAVLLDWPAGIHAFPRRFYERRNRNCARLVVNLRRKR